MERFQVQDERKKEEGRAEEKKKAKEQSKQREGFFHQKIIKVFYGDDGFCGPAVRSVNVRG